MMHALTLVLLTIALVCDVQEVRSSNPAGVPRRLASPSWRSWCTTFCVTDEGGAPV